MTKALPLNSRFVALLVGEASRTPSSLFDSAYQEHLQHLEEGGTVKFEDMELIVPSGVYAPRPGSSTEFVSRNWRAAELDGGRGSLLEIGAGSGALTLFAAKQGWRAIGADIDEVAVASARANARKNGIAARFVHSNLFGAFSGERFDVVLFNQPFFHKPVVQPHERPLADANGELTRRMLDEAASLLNPGGKLVFTFSNCSHAHLLERNDWSFELSACDYESRGRYWRTLLVARPV
jgi:methylase of polypeptide subunit release factors